MSDVENPSTGGQPPSDVRPVSITEEMKRSYLDYAMSVIVSRALPDVRDGLKPVHRRLMHAMRLLRLDPNSAFKKSARVVGDVIGQYHPHGDQSIYDALVRLAQEFSVRYPLIEGQGNFGSMDGDPPAAMRYTEARLATVAETLLADARFSANHTLTVSDTSDALLDGTLNIAVAGRYTFDNFEEAHHALEARRMLGKPLLVVAD